MAITRAQGITFLTDLQADVLASLADDTSRLAISASPGAGILTHESGVLADVFNWRDAQLPALHVFTQSNQQEISGTVATHNFEALVTVLGIVGRGADKVSAETLRGLAMELFTWMADQPTRTQGDRLNGRLDNSATMSQFTVTPFLELVDPAGASSSHNMIGAEVSFVISQSINPRA